MGVAFEIFAEGAAEDAHAGAVNDADAGEAGEEGLIDVAFDLAFGFVGSATDDVEFEGDVDVGVDAGGSGDGDVGAAAAFGEGIRDGGVLGDFVAGDAHFELTDGDFEVAVVDQVGDAGFAIEGLEANQVTGFERTFLRLLISGGFAGVGVIGDGGGELLGELTAESGHAEGGVAGDFAGEGLVVDGFDGVAELGFEVGDEAVEFGFEIAGALLDFVAAFGVEAIALHADFVLAAAEVGAFFGGGGELGMELIEKGADVGGLGGEISAGVGDDVW